MTANFMLRETYERLSEKLKQIIGVEIPKISKAKQKAAEEGDLSENAEYQGCKEKLELLHSQYENIKQRISQPTFIESLRIAGNIVSIGTKVKVEENGKNRTYLILGSPDTDVENDIISFTSPLAKGMIGKKAGAELSIDVPDGVRKIKILDIKPFNK